MQFQDLTKQRIEAINDSGKPVLALDVPSGLDADTGHAGTCVRASHTLGLLALKPGLFTAQGRDASGVPFPPPVPKRRLPRPRRKHPKPTPA